MTSPTTIVLATANPHKIAELRAILGAAAPYLRFHSITEASGGRDIPEPSETGTTFEQNATIKAVAYARALRLPCLADDSGLEIDALGGKPGVISSHYSTDGRETGLSRAERDAANNARVLRELEGVPEIGRSARFVCVMVLADETGVPLHTSLGTFEGRIGIPPAVPRGASGFGYDPLFLVAPEPFSFTKTSAELNDAEKNRLSHRGAAARAMSQHLSSRR
ncbi:MAG: non-canonical purine NTP pyrophosphatase [Phycisphaerales bacterium]